MSLKTKLSDQRVIQFFAKSPVKSFRAMLDTLRYVNGQCIPEELEYELFEGAIGAGRRAIRLPERTKGISENALLRFVRYAQRAHFVRRRSFKAPAGSLEPGERVVSYSLTPAGKGLVALLVRVVGDARPPRALPGRWLSRRKRRGK